VDDAGLVGGAQCVGDLHSEPQDRIDGEWPLGQAIGQRLAFEVLQDEVVDAVLLPDVVERADVGMVEGGDGAGLALEARAQVRVRGQVFREDLDGYGAVQARVARLVHLAHAACAEAVQDLVGTESRSDHQSHCLV